MRHAPATLHHSQAYRPLPLDGAIEWEELPSLTARIGACQSTPPCGAAWDSTRPAELDAVDASQPFHEPLQGVAMREVTEPDIFRHFFGK